MKVINVQAILLYSGTVAHKLQIPYFRYKDFLASSKTTKMLISDIDE